MNKIVYLVAMECFAALAVVSCQAQPTYRSKMEILTEPNSTPGAISSPIPTVSATPTSKPAVRSVTTTPRPTSTPTTSSSVIPPQSGSCKDLAAKGIKNIDVATNSWASRLDRDNDGIACEAN
ncbi:MAG: excalibur calcium-binding domain-containing protein [Spirirestis rafaelensis WJT71-NPBG6]|jgi:hypothetical protein|nr:excalibur calcium-binding domain-containing protein [Spirirestis rafaelensis WJT71-NPBG6]